VYGRNNAGPNATVSPFTADPVITSCKLFVQTIFTPHIEKTAHLSSFEQKNGQIYKILDFEEQLNNVVSNNAGVQPAIKLDNFRLDSQFLMFVVRDGRINTPFQLDRTMTDSTVSIVPGGGSVNGLLPINTLQLKANGSIIVDQCTEIENRALWRKLYLPSGQIAGFVYFIPFSWLIRDAVNVSGFQNMANLGNVELILDLPAGPVGAPNRIVDVYNVCHNVIMMKKGDIVKALR
jgi:hypothetical protein